MTNKNENYLKNELYLLLKKDDTIFEFLQAGSLDGLWYWDLEYPINEWMSPAFWELLGYDPKTKKHLSSEWQTLINVDDLKVTLSNLELHCKDPNHPYDQIVRYKHKNGKTIWVRCRGMAIRDKSGKPVRMLGAHNDVTELKETQQKFRSLTKKLKKLATIDPLTSLLNRRSLYARMEEMLSIANRMKVPMSIIMLDIDRFKQINDKFGHSAGDAVLKKVAQLLKDVFRKADMICRYGGEEFLVGLLDFDQPSCVNLSNRLQQSIMKIDNRFNLTISVGITTIRHDTNQSISQDLCENLINQADEAMYTAKKKGRNLIVHFNELKDL